jgi:hypothetical protein
MSKSLLYQTQTGYFKPLLTFRGIDFKEVGEYQYKISGFDEYNYLVDINSCFSTHPSGDIIDRTNQVSMPFNFHIDRPWSTKPLPIALDECFRLRVSDLTNCNKKLNLLWSGGIDSTAMIVGFLKYCTNLDQLRILYSSYSIKEHPRFFLDLLQIPAIEMVEFSGDVYMNQDFDGLFVSADVADDITASLDQSFFEEVGFKGLHSSWKDLFYKKTNDLNFVNFCEKYFLTSQIPINTVLQARWWFYVICKIQKFPPNYAKVLNDDQPLAVGFFDTEEFETYTYYNMEKIIESTNYNTYKQFLKDFIYNYDKDLNYKKNKQKIGSRQLAWYASKRSALKSSNYIMLLRDGTRIRTKNLPLISQIEFEKQYGNTLDYLFNC